MAKQDGPVDVGPHPNCPRCKGTGRCDNPQFRCACRWDISPHRAEAELVKLAKGGQ